MKERLLKIRGTYTYVILPHHYRKEPQYIGWLWGLRDRDEMNSTLKGEYYEYHRNKSVLRLIVPKRLY